MNLIEIIYDQMITDDYNTSKSSHRILETYDNADSETKDIIDDILISLCGYSMPTLIDMVRDNKAN